MVMVMVMERGGKRERGKGGEDNRLEHGEK